MRNRYYVRIGKLDRAISAARQEGYRAWKERGRPLPYTEFMNLWFLEKHDIVYSQQANGVEKIGFKSKGDMLLFALKYI